MGKNDRDRKTGRNNFKKSKPVKLLIDHTVNDL